MAAKKNKNKVYLVEIEPDTYKSFQTWSECESFVHGRNVRFAGGATEAEALAKLIRSINKSPTRPADYPTKGICSDAGTRGNPGPCEYQITDLNGTVLEHKHLGVHSNNFAELAGVGAMIQFAIRTGEKILWTDSKIALGWIQTGRIGETVHERDVIVRMVHKIQGLLRVHSSMVLKKWQTRRWGQIPADFGRK
ncbi:MAG: hypothetical protein KDC35_16475 [Acidobacteria bacterium]|nr:hypothetical protein [Acidobacteriota bacterium]